MALAMQRKTNVRLPPEINRILYVRNLPYKITGEEMYDIFGKYGAIRQIRVGNTPETRGTAFVVYEDIFDAKNACDHLSGFNVCNRYLVVLYYQANKAFKKTDLDKKQEEIDKMKSKYGINTRFRRLALMFSTEPAPARMQRSMPSASPCSDGGADKAGLAALRVTP
ncbi:hypothetical protein HUJ05_011083, partial [Dendroctonus ponderosae]